MEKGPLGIHQISRAARGRQHCAPPPPQSRDAPTEEEVASAVKLVTKAEGRERAAKTSREAANKAAFRRWDARRNHSRCAFARTRANYQPPTTSIRDPDQSDHFTFDQRRIHDLFMQDWSGVYRRHSEHPPDVREFRRLYGEYVPKVQLPN